MFKTLNLILVDFCSSLIKKLRMKTLNLNDFHNTYIKVFKKHLTVHKYERTCITYQVLIENLAHLINHSLLPVLEIDKGLIPLVA